MLPERKDVYLILNLDQSLLRVVPQNANDSWTTLRDAIYDSPMESLGKNTHKSNDR